MEEIFYYPKVEKAQIVISNKLRELDKRLFEQIVATKIETGKALSRMSSGKIYAKYVKLMNEKAELCWVYSKKKRFNTETVFSFCEGVIFVEKRFVDHPETDKIFYKDLVFLSLAKVPVTNGRLVKLELRDMISCGKFKEFERLLLEFISVALKKFAVKDKNVTALPPPCIWLDAMPRNTIISEGGFVYFDLEYQFREELAKDFFIFRVCKDVWEFNKSLLDEEFGGNFVKHVLEKFDIKYSEKLEEEMIKQEARIQNLVMKEQRNNIIDRVKKYLYKKSHS